MGVCLTEQGRHSTTREAHGQIEPGSLSLPIDSIIGANSEVTTAIEAHRQALREGGIVQPPAPTESLTTIECPVNLRKDSIRIVGAESSSDNDDKSIGGDEEDTSSTLSILCNLDIQIESLLEVNLIRKGNRIRRRIMRINQRGIGVSVLVDLAPSEAEIEQSQQKRTNTIIQKLFSS